MFVFFAFAVSQNKYGVVGFIEPVGRKRFSFLLKSLGCHKLLRFHPKAHRRILGALWVNLDRSPVLDWSGPLY